MGYYAPSRPAEGCFDHYEIARRDDGTLDELGPGVMGITYKAFDVHLRCPVTLKVINENYVGDESARLRFLRAARAAGSLRHRCDLELAQLELQFGQIKGLAGEELCVGQPQQLFLFGIQV